MLNAALAGKFYTQVVKARLLAALLLVMPPVFAQSGAVLFQQNCSFCHGENGQGRAGVFPPLAGHAPNVIATPEGRAYLIQVLLFGLQGEIKVKGQKYNGVMAAFGQLSNEQVAAILNHVLTAWGNDKLLAKDHKPITAAEVAAVRIAKLTPQEVAARRSRLKLE